MGGISTAAATVFFAFIGFDALAANSAETIDPKKNVVRGILETVSLSFHLTIDRLLLLIAALWLILLMLIFVCLLISLVEMWLGSLILRIR